MLPRRLLWLRDVVDFEAIALRLSKLEQYSGVRVEDLEHVFRQFFFQEAAAWWFYSQRQCQQQTEEIVELFVQNVAANLISD